MFLPKTLFAAVASLGLVSCNSIYKDEIAAWLLMGRDASELFIAYGEPDDVEGNIDNYVLTWSGSVSTPMTISSIDTGSSSIDIPHNYFVKVRALHDRIVAMTFSAYLEFISDEWLDKNALLVDFGDFCANNELEELQVLLAKHPSLSEPQIISQATALAVQCKAVEVSRYLINTYKVDINKNIVAPRITGTWDGFEFDMSLKEMTISQLLRENGIVL